MTGTVVRAGERPLVQWDNGLQNDVFHIKLIGVDVKGKIEKIKDKIYEIRNKLGV